VSPQEAYDNLQRTMQTETTTRWRKCAPVWVRDVPVGYVNVARLNGHIESSRPCREGEFLAMNPKGGETWMPHKATVMAKTESEGTVTVEGVQWEIRVPNDHPDNIIQTIQYDGRLGALLEFYKPRWGNCMTVKTGGYIAWNAKDPTDIWAIDELAIGQLYKREQ